MTVCSRQSDLPTAENSTKTCRALSPPTPSPILLISQRRSLKLFVLFDLCGYKQSSPCVAVSKSQCSGPDATSIDRAQASRCERSRARAATLTKSPSRPLAVRYGTQTSCENSTYDDFDRWMAPVWYRHRFGTATKRTGFVPVSSTDFSYGFSQPRFLATSATTKPTDGRL